MIFSSLYMSRFATLNHIESHAAILPEWRLNGDNKKGPCGGSLSPQGKWNENKPPLSDGDQLAYLSLMIVSIFFVL